jgi:hypothetical protein
VAASNAQEPTIQSCLKIIQSTCLAQGLELRVAGGGTASKKFQDHLDNHYVRFCEQAIRSMFACGFVPWRLRKLSSGDPVPEVIPMGLFMWSTETLSERERSRESTLQHGHQSHHHYYYYSNDNKSSNNSSSSNARSATARPAQHPGQGGAGPPPKAQHPQRIVHSGGAAKRRRVAATMQEEASIMYIRQQRALQRQPQPVDDNDTKALQYKIHFTEVRPCLSPFFLRGAVVEFDLGRSRGATSGRRRWRSTSTSSPTGT